MNRRRFLTITAACAAILAAPAHPCTQALLAAEPGIRY